MVNNHAALTYAIKHGENGLNLLVICHSQS